MLHQLSSQLHSEHKLHLQRLHQAFYMHCQMGQDPLQRHRPSRLPRHSPSLFTLLCPYWPLLPRPALLPFSSRVQIPSGSRPGETCHCAGRAIPAAAAFGHSRVSALFRMAGARQSVGEETGRTGRGRRERGERINKDDEARVWDGVPVAAGGPERVLCLALAPAFVLVFLRPLTLLLLYLLFQEHHQRPRHTTPWATPATA